MLVYAVILHFGDGGAFYTEETIKLYERPEDAVFEKERLEGIRDTNKRLLNLQLEKERTKWWSTLEGDDMAAANCDWVSVKPMEVIGDTFEH